jgi:hypothetical protein
MYCVIDTGSCMPERFGPKRLERTVVEKWTTGQIPYTR